MVYVLLLDGFFWLVPFVSYGNSHVARLRGWFLLIVIVLLDVYQTHLAHIVFVHSVPLGTTGLMALTCSLESYMAFFLMG